MKKLYSILLLLFIGIQSSFGTHILGGEVTYKYLGSDGPANRPFRYSIRFVGYVDRVGTSGQLSNWGCGNLAVDPFLAIYDASNNQRISRIEGGAQPEEVFWRLPSHGDPIQGPCPINPYYGGIRPLVIPVPAACVVPGLSELNIAITDTTFEVELPLSLSGYKIKYENCCRTENTTNINFPGGNNNPGNSWVATIPSPIFVNSSPQFIGDAVPFFCRGDTAIISNNAFDPDGDRLIYSFANPYSGRILGGPSNTYSDPTNATFAAGFSETQPFGPNGYAFINPSTGLTKYYSNQNGNYAVAIDIQEYRTLSNGTEILLSTTRREFLVVVKDCAPNPPPTPVTGSTSQGTTFIRTEGDSVVFDIKSFDVDTTTISAESELFDINNDIGEVAICPTVTGKDTVRTRFRWKIQCGVTKGITRNYSVVVKYADRGCPPKTNTVVYTIIVNPFKAPTILGKDSICSTDQLVQYAVTPGTGRQWKIFGGTITGSSTSNVVSVSLPGDTARLRLVVTSGLGCKDSTSKRIRKFNLVPILATSGGEFVCEGGTQTLNATGGYSAVSWSPAAGLSSTTSRNPIASPTDTVQYVVTSNGPGGCVAKDTVALKWIPKIANAGTDSILCSGLSRVIGLNQPTGYRFYSYAWTPATGVVSDTSFRTRVNLTNSGTGNQTFTFVQTATHRASSCSSKDTVRLVVKPLPVVNAGPDTATICSKGQTLIGTQDNANALFSWSPVVGLTSPLKDTTTATLENPDTLVFTQKYFLTKTEILTSPLPGEPVCLNVDSIVVKVNPLPAFDLALQDSLCSGDTIAIGTADKAGYSYSWSPTTGILSSSSAGTRITLVNTGLVPFDSVYTLTVTNGSTTCQKSKQIRIRVNPLPVVTAGLDTSLCSGDSIQIGESPESGFSYAWSPTAGIASPGNGNPFIRLINPNVGGSNLSFTYTVVKTNNQTTCKKDDAVEITVKPLPIAVASAFDTVTICSKGSLQLGQDSLSRHVYNWLPDTALSNPSISNPFVSINNPSQQVVLVPYKLKVTNLITTCKNEDSVVVKVNPLPIVPLNYADTSVCSRDTLILGGSGAIGFTYTWSPAKQLSDSTLSAPSFSAINGTDAPILLPYQLLVQNQATNCQDLKTLTVQVNPLPDANAGSDVEVCSRDSIQIGSAPVAGRVYRWSPVEGLSNPDIANPKLSLVNNTNQNVQVVYTVSVVDATLRTNCDSSDAVTVTVKPLPTAIAFGSDTAVVCSSLDIALGVGPEPGLTYQWSPGLNLTDSLISNPVYNFQATNGNTTSLYVLTVQNPGNSCQKKDTVYLKVNPLPVVNAGLDTAFCSGDSIRIGELSENGFSYAWTPGLGLNGAADANPYIRLQNPNTGGASVSFTYKVLKTNTSTSCKQVDSLQITVKPLPIVIASSADTVTICSKGSLQLGSAGLADHSYLWAPDTALSSSTVPDPTVSIQNPTQTIAYLPYTLQATNALTTCKNTDVVTVKVNPLPLFPFAYADTSVCTKENLALGGPAVSGFTYAWSPQIQLNDTTVANPTFQATNGSDSQVDFDYSLLVTNQQTNCQNTKTVKVRVNPLPDANAGNDVEVCSRDSVQIGSAPQPGFKYSWSPTAGLSNPNVANPKLSLINNGTTNQTVSYTVTVTDTTFLTRCDSTDEVVIIVKPLPQAVAAVSDSVQVCATLDLQLGITGDPLLNYSWTPGADLSSTNVANPVFNSNTGSGSAWPLYVVTVNNPGNGCSKKDSVYIRINSLPVVNVGSLDSLCSGDTVSIGPGSIAVPTQVVWAPTIGFLNSNPAQPLISLINSGSTVLTQPYKMIVTNTQTGCKDSSTLNVRINPLPAANAGTDRTICSGETIEIGTATQLGYGYAWEDNTGLSLTNISNPTYTATATGNPNVQTLVVQMTDLKTTCRKRDTTVVTTNPRPVPMTFASFSGTVCPFTTNVPYTVTNNEPGFTYAWSVSGGSQVSGGNTNSINVNWNGPNANARVFVTPTNQYGCAGTLDSLQIVLNQQLKPTKPLGDSVICSYVKTGKIYSTVPTPGSTYTWSFFGATTGSSISTDGVTSVDWNINDGIAKIWIQQQSSTIDPGTGTPVQCFGVSDTLFVQINPSPDSTLAIFGPASVCINPDGTNASYTLPGFAGSTFAWAVDPAGPVISGQGNDTASVNWNAVGDYAVSVLETSNKGCVGRPRTLDVKTHPLPQPGLSSLSNLTICPNDLQKGYFAQSAPGFENSVFSWAVSGGTASTPTNQTFLGVNWNAEGPYSLILTETSDKGCQASFQAPLVVDPSRITLSNVSLIEADENQVEIKFAMSSQETNPSDISLWRRERGNGAFTLVQGAMPKNTTQYIDQPGNTSARSYEYQVRSTNVCVRPIESEVHNTILLQVMAPRDGETATLDWNNYIGWNSGASYSVLRKVDSQTELLSYESSIPDAQTMRRIYDNAPDGFQHCYRVVAFENLGNNKSNSNTVCVTFENALKFFTLFTPNGDNMNDAFEIKNLHLYPDNELSVYDRWGREVYKKSGYADSDLWNGDDLNEGVYFYKFVVPSKGLEYNGWITIKR